MNSEFDFKWNCFGDKSHIFNAFNHVRERIHPPTDRHHVMTYLIGKNSGELENVKETLVSFQHSVAIAMQVMQIHVCHLENVVNDQANDINSLQTIVHKQAMQIECLLQQNASELLQNGDTIHTTNIRDESLNVKTSQTKKDSNHSSSDQCHKHDTIAVHSDSPFHVKGKNVNHSQHGCLIDFDDSHLSFDSENITQMVVSPSNEMYHNQHVSPINKVTKADASKLPTKCVGVKTLSSVKLEMPDTEVIESSTLSKTQSNTIQARTGVCLAIPPEHRFHGVADDQSITDTKPATLGMDLN